MSGLDRIAECKRARTPGAPVPCGRGRLTGATLIVRRHTIPRVTAEDCDIRPATPADSSAIRRIRNAAIRDSLAIWTEREQGPDEAAVWLEPQIARGTALVAVERNEGGERVVGFAVASPWHPYEGYARTVEDSIYLSPTARGRGLGTRLLTALVRACWAAGDRTMVAQIESGHAASRRLHEKAGFALVGTIPAAGQKHGRILDLTLMTRRLDRS